MPKASAGRDIDGGPVAGESKEGQKEGKSRAFRGLVLTFFLTFLNLVGLFLTAVSLGVLGEWNRWQFIGLYGVIESAAGLACLFLPNIWHLPVTEEETSSRTEVQMAASTLLLPHWGALARSGAGAVMLAVAMWHEGVDSQTALLLPFILAIALATMGLSMAVARLGVAFPHIDVVQVTINWNKKARKLPGLSVGASFIQLCLGVATLPVADLLSPGALYRPEVGPTLEALTIVVVAAALSMALALGVWAGRLSWQAPREQQVEIEAKA